MKMSSSLLLPACFYLVAYLVGIWLKTYAFMGPFYEGKLKGRWADSCQELARRFPNDGANFCAIWQRV